MKHFIIQRSRHSRPVFVRELPDGHLTCETGRARATRLAIAGLPITAPPDPTVLDPTRGMRGATAAMQERWYS